MMNFKTRSKMISIENVKHNMQTTRVHSIIIVIMLLQISLITVGFYLQFTFFMRQNESFEKQISNLIDDTVRNIKQNQWSYFQENRISKREALVSNDNDDRMVILNKTVIQLDDKSFEILVKIHSF